MPSEEDKVKQTTISEYLKMIIYPTYRDNHNGQYHHVKWTCTSYEMNKPQPRILQSLLCQGLLYLHQLRAIFNLVNSIIWYFIFVVMSMITSHVFWNVTSLIISCSKTYKIYNFWYSLSSTLTFFRLQSAISTLTTYTTLYDPYTEITLNRKLPI
jgi:hypothetical protein